LTLTSYQWRAFAPKKKGGKSNKDKQDEAKEAVKSEFEGKELDDIRREYAESLIFCYEELDESL